MSQSMQATAVNKTLKYLVKPLIYRLPITPRMKRIAQPTFDVISQFNPVPGNIKVDKFKIGRIPAEMIHSGSARPERIMLYLHGGGYFFGSARTHRPLTCRLSNTCRTKVLAINYRQQPQHEHPAPIEDAVLAYQWILEQGYEPKNVIFAGDSAGGNLTLTSMLQLREQGIGLPGGAICISPWADLSNSVDSLKDNAKSEAMIHPRTLKAIAKAYVGDNDPKDPLLSPIYGEFEGFPPMLIYVGSTELLRDGATIVADKAKASGVNVTYKEWEDLFHVFPLAAGFIPEGKMAIRGIRRFVEESVYQNIQVK